MARTDDRATEPSDLVALLDLFREAGSPACRRALCEPRRLDPGATHAVARASSQLARACKGGGRQRFEGTAAEAESALRIALLAGYPDRVAKRVRHGSRGLALAGGGSAELAETSVVRDAEWLVALDAEERQGPAPGPRIPGAPAPRGGVVVRLASAIEPEWLLDLFPADVVEERAVTWDARAERVQSREAMIWDGLVLHASESADAPAAEASRVLAEAALAAGPGTFAPREAMDHWLARARFAASVEGSANAPDDSAVRAAIEQICEGRRSFAELREANCSTCSATVLASARAKSIGSPPNASPSPAAGASRWPTRRASPPRSRLGSRTSLA